MRGGLARTTSWGRSVWLLAAAALATGCIFGDKHHGDDDDGGDGGQSGDTTGGTSQGGSTSKGGTTSKGGSTSSGGSTSKGGSSARGGSSNGGSVADGGTFALGGTVSSGGTVSNGGSGGDLVLGGTGGDIGIGGTNSSGGSGGSVSTGGSGATGGSSGTGGGDPPDGTCSEAFRVQDGGYVTSLGESCWRGYAYTVADTLGTLIAPTDFSGCASASCLCASGTLAGDETFQTYAGLGFALDQDPMLDAPEGLVSPSGSGLTISYVNTGSSSLRVQISDGTTRWCYDGLTGTDGTVTIPYTSFNTECWVGGSGDYYLGQPISTVQLVMPGAASSVPFNVCLAWAKDAL